MTTFNTINGCNVMSNANGNHMSNANGVKVIPTPSNSNDNHTKPDDGKLRESKHEG
ncbi:hypothetical protein [Helicobacter sp. 13S00482-2]|uniref:hypothetical protein n=1 Tax=Helicobacter sp. 13S00482-2 TaxID=1476200 RepID=UPI0015DABF99|nr:hypothetical protein [Helicobacter sp. 13S00482-2]